MKMPCALATVAVVLLSFCLVATVAYAKRKAPPSIPPLRIGSVEYRVPNTIETEGIVEAWNAAGGTMLWHRKIYSTIKLPGFLMETDVQCNFITNMSIGPGPDELTIANEKGRQYILNTGSKKVRRK